jgi:hypothetical protein
MYEEYQYVPSTKYLLFDFTVKVVRLTRLIGYLWSLIVTYCGILNQFGSIIFITN